MALSLFIAEARCVLGDTQETATSRFEFIVFAVTIILAVAVGVVLSIIARKSSAARYKEKVKNFRGQSLKSLVSDEVESLIASGKNPKVVINELVDIFDEKLEERADAIKEELDEKYEIMIEEKEQAVVELNRKYTQVSIEKKQTESIVKSVAEGLVLVNNKGEVILMNPAAEKLFGVKKEDKIGKPILQGLRDEQLVSLVKESSSGEKEIVLTSNSADTKRILRSSGAIIEDEDGNTVGMVSVLSDVTKQKELDQMKADFVSSVSHELRTPIVAMGKSLDVMMDPAAGTLSENQKQFLNIARRNMERLDNLINDLLDLSKLEAKKMNMNFQVSSLEEAINETCDTLNTWANTKGIEIKKIIQKDLPKFTFDYQRVIQVLTNLIGNAIKFTPSDGRVTIDARFLNQKKMVEVSITDTGMGIAKDDIPKLFSKFQQVGKKNLSDTSGTGLGLAIAKEIVQLHNGEIWVESEKGKGAKFTFVLPATNNQNNTGG